MKKLLPEITCNSIILTTAAEPEGCTAFKLHTSSTGSTSSQSSQREPERNFSSLSGRYVGHEHSAVSPKLTPSLRDIDGKSTAAQQSLQFSLTLGAGQSPLTKPRPGQLSPNDPSLQRHTAIGSLIQAATQASYKFAPQGSGFGGKGLPLAGRPDSSNSGIHRGSPNNATTAAPASGKACNAHATNTTNTNSSSRCRDSAVCVSVGTRHCSNGSSNASRCSKIMLAPGSLLTTSSLSEALQICPFSGDASAGALMLATAATFTTLCGSRNIFQVQAIKTGGQTRSGSASAAQTKTAVQQQVGWK